MRSLIALVALVAYAQAPPQSPTFEVVSVKPSPPGAGQSVSSSGGPGTGDPGLWTCRSPNLANIIVWAFQLHSLDELAAPDWMLDSRFDIDARVPAGTTHDQFYQMLQNMLIERFGLKFHLDKTEVPGYELVVGKSGLKLKESTVPPQSVNILLSPTFDRAGYPVYPPDAQGTGGRDNHRGGHWPSITMQRFARILSQTLSSPVVDATGLSATYEVSLRWVPNPDLPDAAGPSIFAALQDQLGLKLNGKKTTVPKVVVDHAEKVPTEN